MDFRLHTELFIVFLICAYDFSSLTSGLDTLTASQYIKEPHTLTSENKKFTLGFFNPENSSNRYVGIWYMSKAAVVWVANRNDPLTDSSGTLKISQDGNLVVLNGMEQVVWSSNVSKSDASCVVLQLSDSGNLVLRKNDTTETVVKWESFQHPSNTFLPKMKWSSNAQTGEKFKLTSWKSTSEPSTGIFYAALEPRKVPELFIWHKNRPYWRSGPWNGQVLTGIPNMINDYVSGYTLVEENGTWYYYLTSEYGDTTDLFFYLLNSQGQMKHYKWDYNKKNWVDHRTIPILEYDIYGICGSFAVCDSLRTPICSCLRGFEPRNAEEWDKRNWTGGCVRRKPLKCEKVKNGDEARKEDGFVVLEKTKVPDFLEWSSLRSGDCRTRCLQNCSCIAYAYGDGIGCMLWSQDLIDIQRFSSGGIDLHIRVDSSELEKGRNFSVIITITVIIGTIMIAACAYGYWTRSKRKGKTYTTDDSNILIGSLKELLMFDFHELASATNNFHSDNKLGQGGFGPVYKGKLQDGQEIAVKRLSSASGQGVQEFMTEVVVISKLQHRNLVKLLGCSVDGGEKMLIYEYMPNKSLDAYLFDPVKQNILDWQKRFNIIEGIARGLLYLHRDSRLRIIHRDLKVSNILLDGELNPKISDFGMAKIFGGSKDEAYTRRVVGTYGYMAPEYAIQGNFSEKSDVFSFGVLLLEIISGRKNASFYNNQLSLSLLGFIWKLWNEENIVSFINPKIYDRSFENDILKCIHVGLLCVQELAKDRPTMTVVILMLDSKIVNLPAPRQPAFIHWQGALEECYQNRHKLSSLCDVTITTMQGR